MGAVRSSPGSVIANDLCDAVREKILFGSAWSSSFRPGTTDKARCRASGFPLKASKQRYSSSDTCFVSVVVTPSNNDSESRSVAVPKLWNPAAPRARNMPKTTRLPAMKLGGPADDPRRKIISVRARVVTFTGLRGGEIGRMALGNLSYSLINDQ